MAKVSNARHHPELLLAAAQMRRLKALKVFCMFFCCCCCYVHVCTALAANQGSWKLYHRRRKQFPGSISALDPLHTQRCLHHAEAPAISTRPSYPALARLPGPYLIPRLALFLRLFLSPLPPTSYRSEQTITGLVWVLRAEKNQKKCGRFGTVKLAESWKGAWPPSIGSILPLLFFPPCFHVQKR